MAKERLDVLTAARGLAESREQAQRLILAGQVLVNGQPACKAGARVPADAELALKSTPRFVGRGGEKLDAAFTAFGLDVAGRVCLDAGASTGGFTDCLLQHGAARVYAVDVGRAQLHARMQKDARVVVMDGVNARYLKPGDLPEQPAFATLDVSFISLTKVLPAVSAMLRPGAQGVALIKPQFEAGRRQVRRGGVVRDPAVRDAVVKAVTEFARDELGLAVRGVCPSPLQGPAGNVEFLFWFEKP
jgi:23S rRNA (cytidine1920-2'-O)/16S rRNA (cytidine1409-2'-O)-methyltransferase